MGLSKTEEFTQEQNDIASLARAMGHPARIAIISHLLNRNTCVCGELVDVLPLSQSTVSQHLKELKKAGIIEGTISGTNVCYCIDTKTWKSASILFENLFSKLKTRNCC